MPTLKMEIFQMMMIFLKRHRLKDSQLLVDKATEIAKPLFSAKVAKEMDIARLQEIAILADEKTTRAEANFDEISKAIACVEASGAKAAPELQQFRSSEAAPLKRQSTSLQEKLRKVADAARAARDTALRKTYAELNRLHVAAVRAIQSVITEEGKTDDELFEQLASEDVIASDKFVVFFQDKPDLGGEDGARRLFTHLAAGEDSLCKDSFLKFVRPRYRVCRATVLTETFDLKSKTRKRMEEGEFLEALGGGKKEETVKVFRLEVKAISDGTTGWVTIMGNKGAVFIEPACRYYMCVVETTMTKGLSITESKIIKKAQKGEVFEVVGQIQKDASCGVTRLHVKALRDDEVGWVSLASNAGTPFLERCW